MSETQEQYGNGAEKRPLTAVEWFMEQIGEKQPNGLYVIDTLEDVKNVFEQAKERERDQIIDAYTKGFEDVDAEQYYNQSYGKP